MRPLPSVNPRTSSGASNRLPTSCAMTVLLLSMVKLGLLGRLDVLIEVEEVRRVILRLEALQPGERLWVISRSHPCLALIGEEVDVPGAGAVWVDRVRGGLDPGDVRRVLGLVVPQRDVVHEERRV